MIVGGNGMNDTYGQSEMVDISGNDLTCPLISAYPVDYGSVGTFINNNTRVCGGYTLSNYKFRCFSYNMLVGDVHFIYIIFTVLLSI